MSAGCLSDYIRQYREGHTNTLELIIQKMSPLLWKYAHKFPKNDWEDMYQEFAITLIECVRQISDYSVEAKCLAYLKTAVIHQYAVLKDQTFTPQYLSETAEYIQDTLSAPDDSCSEIEFLITFQAIRQKLSPTKQMIFDELLNGRTCLEIAKKMHKSRQYINTVRLEIQNLLKCCEGR